MTPEQELPRTEATSAGTGEGSPRHAAKHGDQQGHEDSARKKGSRHAGKKTGKKGKSFPVGGLLFMFLLIAAILAALYFGMRYMNEYERLKGEYDSSVQAAEAERDAAKALYEEADPDSEVNTAQRRAVTDELIAEANAEIDALREQSEETESAVRAAEEKIAELQDIEDYDYYRAIYEEYLKGGAFVEGLLSGD